MADNVTPEQVLKEVLEQIAAGCDAAGTFESGGTKHECTISKEAVDQFYRRYLATVTFRLQQNNPGDWQNRDRASVLPVAFAHGEVAGAMWRHLQTVQGPGATPQVSKSTLMKAGNVMEAECQGYLERLAALTMNPDIIVMGGYCW